MKDLSLNLLDISQNSVTAGASRIDIEVHESQNLDRVSITITDNGRGMSPEFLAAVTDPFVTTRTTRKVGLGLPLLKMEAEMADGGLEIESAVGVGTKVHAWFRRSHIDMPPPGDMTGSIVTLIQGNPNLDIYYTRRTDAGEYTLATPEVREELGGVPLDEPEVLAWLTVFLTENDIEIDK